MGSLSVCMIVKNEEDVLARCLSCACSFADEIIVVDTGSTDATKDIALSFTPLVFDFPWIDDFAAARNFSFSKATCDYLMWLDADDVIDEENQAGIKALMESMSPDTDMVMMKYHVGFDANEQPTFSYFRERIMKRSIDYKWVGEIHEVVQPSGNIIHRDLAISHRKIRANEKERNLKIFQKLLADGKKLEPRQSYYYARELYYNNHIPAAVLQFEAFLAEGKGWIENNISACKDLAACYYLSKDSEKAFSSLLRSFKYDSPRAEICCEIGKLLMEKSLYEAAIFWYKLAASRSIDHQSGAFYLSDCYDYIPYIQICVCYDRLGNLEQAILYNELAGKIKPQDKCYLYNKQYFSSSK